MNMDSSDLRYCSAIFCSCWGGARIAQVRNLYLVHGMVILRFEWVLEITCSKTLHFFFDILMPTFMHYFVAFGNRLRFVFP